MKKKFKGIISTIALLTAFLLPVTVSASDDGAAILGGFECLMSDGKLTVSFEGDVYNDSTEAENIIIAIYNDDILTNAKIYSIDPKKHKNRLYECEFDVGDAEAVSVRAFRWEKGSLIPLEAAAAVPQCPDRTVSFSCRSVLGYIGYDFSGGIPVRSSGEGEPDTMVYHLADDAEFFVNGVSAGAVTNDLIYTYVLSNPSGTVTLADAGGDGKYDRVRVELYVNAVVDYTTISSKFARVYFKSSGSYAGKMVYDPLSDADIRFIKDGRAINFSDIKEYDVLSVKYDIINNGKNGSSLDNPEYAKILVSDKTVNGMVTAVDEASNSIILDGNRYFIDPNMLIIEAFEPDIYYELRLDAFGFVADFSEHEALKSYGVVCGMHRQPDSGRASILLIDKNGKEQNYPILNDTEADKFYNYIVNGSEYYTDSFEPVEELSEKLHAGETVCSYTLDENGCICFSGGYYPKGGSGLRYRALMNKLSAYKISENTRILYLGNGVENAEVMQLSDLEDKAEYSAYLFDKNAEGIFRFALIFSRDLPDPEEPYESPLTKLMNSLPDDKNSVVSPLSIKLAMLMIANGAEGETRKEITDAYELTEPLEIYNERIKELLCYYASPCPDGSVVNISNSIWFNTDMATDGCTDFTPPYKRELKNHFYAEAGNVTNDTYKPTIDGWVSDKTQGLITEIVPDGETALTAHVNTVYMKARWAEPFSKSETEKEVFYNADGSETETDFMCQENRYFYYRDADRQAVLIPYGNGTAMYIVRGNADNFESLIDSIRAEENYRLVSLAIPKFKLEYRAYINDVMDNMGIKKVFGSNAELEPMLGADAPEGGMSAPLHKAVIDVDEDGTTAAAVTYISKGGSAMPGDERIYSFTADKPFSYFIVGRNNEVLFAGKYVNAER